MPPKPRKPKSRRTGSTARRRKTAKKTAAVPGKRKIQVRGRLKSLSRVRKPAAPTTSVGEVSDFQTDVPS